MSEWVLFCLLAVVSVTASLALLYPLRRNMPVCFYLFPVMVVSVGMAYLHWGGHAALKKHMHQQRTMKQVQAVLKSIKTPQELIDKLKAKLKADPSSAQGWYLLGRLYSAQQDLKAANLAFVKAHQLNPTQEDYAVELAFCLYQRHDRHITPEISSILNQLLKANPDQADALSLLAMDSFMSHNYADAINYWQHLLRLVHPDSKESQALRQAIATAQNKSNP